MFGTFFTDNPVKDWPSAKNSDTQRFREILPGHAGTRRLPGTFTVRGRVYVNCAQRSRNSGYHPAAEGDFQTW